jgi:hypothetical protein
MSFWVQEDSRPYEDEATTFPAVNPGRWFLGQAWLVYFDLRGSHYTSAGLPC